MNKLYPLLLHLIVLLLIGQTAVAGTGTNQLSNYFIENKGQAHDERGAPADNVLFYQVGGPMQVFITTTGYSVIVKESGKGGTRYNKIDFNLDGASINKSAINMLKGIHPKINMYGADQKSPMVDLTATNTLIIKNIYPGIDWKWTIDKNGKPEHDFLVNLGADASRIKITVAGATPGADGNNINYKHERFALTEGPFVYELKNKNENAKVVLQGNHLSFEISEAGKKGGFTIDPSLSLTWISGYDSFGTGFRSIVADANLNTITTGYSRDYRLPIFPQVNGTYQENGPQQTDVVIMKTDAIQNLVWATFFGGSFNDEGNAVVACPTGIFITGFSESWNFPQAIEGSYNHPVAVGNRDAFVAKFDNLGKLLWSTGFGGSSKDEAQDIKYYNGHIFIAGYTNSDDLPIQYSAGQYNQTLSGDTNAFIAEFDTAGNKLWSTYFGGQGSSFYSSVFADASGTYATGYANSPTGHPIPLQTLGGAYNQTTFQGSEGFITRFTTGNSLDWSTYFGGAGNDIPSCILRNNCGLFICGKTSGTGLPVIDQGNGNYYQSNYAGGGSDGFVAKFDASTLQQTYGTYYGTSGDDALTKLASDNNCNTIFTGFTNTSAFTTTGSANLFFVQTANHGGFDGLMLGLDQNQNMFWSTYFGATGNDFGYSVQFRTPVIVDMVGEGFYNYGELRIGGTYLSDICPGGQGNCPEVTCNGVSNRFLDTIGDVYANIILQGGGQQPPGNGCPDLLFQALIPLKNTCPNQCNGVARIDTSNIGGCPPYRFLWSDGTTGLIDSNLCENFWTEIFDSTGRHRILYDRFDVLRVGYTPPVTSGCGIMPGWDTIIHPAGGGPPYTISYRTSQYFCPATAYFNIYDTANCVISDSVTWFQQNTQLRDSLYIDKNCNLNATLKPGPCINTDSSYLWFYHIYNNTDTFVVPFGSGSALVPGAPSTGFYTGYLDIGTCTSDLIPLFYTSPINYTVSTSLNCQLNTGSISFKIVPDTAIINYYGSYTVDVSVSGPASQSTSLLINHTSTDSVALTGLPNGHYNYNVKISSPINIKICTDSIGDTVNLNTIKVRLNNISVYCNKPDTLKATVSGGVPPYTFHWSNGTSSSAIVISIPGTYTLTVTDFSGCSDTISTIVSGSAKLKIDSVRENLIPCSVTLFTTAQVYTSGGTPPLNYVWNSGENSNPASLLPQGVDWVRVFDIYGCSDTLSFSNTKKSLLQVTDTITNLRCYNSHNGSVMLNVSQGYTPYHFAWSNGGQSASVSSLAAGTYGFTVTDSKNCLVSGSAVVTQPDSLRYVLSTLPATCDLYNGQASLSVAGGTPPITNVWSNGATGFSVTGLRPGTYSFVVSDTNGCTRGASFIIKKNNTFAVTLTTVNDSCYNLADGQAAITDIQNGEAPFTYTWYGPNTFAVSDSFITNLQSGQYSVQVIDDRGCIFDSIFYIIQPDPLNFNIDYIDSATCSQNNGSLNGYAYGGTYPYNYAWSDGSYGNYPSNDFAPGSNFVIITDANNCIDTSGFTIPISNSLAASSVQENDVSCYGGSNGSAAVNLSDNYPVVYYNWFDGSSDPTISGLSTGNYAVTITDYNGCTSILGFTVNEPLPVNFVTNQIDSATCSQNNGGINGYGSGGTYPYTYSGSSGSFGNSIPNTFGAGNNLLIVTDQNGCTDSVTFSVPLSNTLAASSVNAVNVNCYNTSNGSASVHLSDPYPQVAYSWFDGSSGSTISNLSVGNYSVTINDNNGCTAAMSFTITQPDPIAVAIDTGSGILCNGANTIVQISATGGNPPYSGVGSFSYGAGTYNVSITDNGGCAAPDTSFTIYGPPPIVASVNIDTAPLCSILTATISVIANGGAPTYTAYLDGSEQGISFTDSAVITGVAAGQHNIIIYDANNCFSSVGFNINAYTPDNIVTNINSPLCYGLNNGNVTLITSGYSPFTYQNNTFTNSYEIDSLTAGIDTFIIYNNVGCADTVIVSITQPDSLSLDYTAYPTSPCFTDSTLVTILASGGTPAYTGTGQFNFPSGNTQVIVIDGNSCRDTMNVDITYPHPFSVTASVLKQPDCTPGTVLITGTGGYSPYTLHLDSVNTLSFTDTISISISGGTYVYAVTDNRGCTQLATFSANPHLPILLDSNIISSGITCHSPADAVITINVTGGGAPGYTYQLNGANTNVGPQAGNTFNNLGPGNYVATVTDSLGCSVQISAHIVPYLPGTDSISVTNLRCNGAATGAIKIYSQPADRGPYTYSLNGGTPQVYNVFYGLNAGNYVITVSDVNGCIDTVHATITQPDTIDGRVWLNGQLLPIDSFTINQRQFATFSKLNTNPWSIVFSPNNPTTLSNDSVIQIQPTEDVSYVVTVYEDSADFDCFVQYQGLVEVIPIPLLPDLITPNGDGANDTWKIDQVKYPTPQVIIFDRWGEIVFRSDAYNNDWGGVYTNGKPVPDGTYFYIMKVPSQNNAVFKGDINVLNASR